MRPSWLDRSLPLASILSLGLAASAAAQDPAPSPDAPVPPAAIRVGGPFHGVFVDDAPSGDGAYWCRGDRYKMRFSMAGAGFMPLFGWRVDRNPLVEFDLPGTPVRGLERRGDGFDLDRGALLERWLLVPHGAEQTFVLRERPTGGVLRIAVRSPLGWSHTDERGLHFAAPGLGEVVYGHAFAVAADGGKAPLRTAFVGGTIEIALPADASYPLVVDPFVSTVPVASGEAGDDRDPDVSYDATTDRWCVVFEERLSVVDTDIKVRRFSGGGTLLDTDFAETSSENSENPAVANVDSANEFFVVWQEGDGDLMGRRVPAVIANLGPFVTVYTGSFGFRALRPDVGGSRNGRYMVVWTEENVLTTPRIYCQEVPATSGGPQGMREIDNQTGCLTARVSEESDPLGHFMIVWTRQASGCVGGDVHYAVVSSLTLEQPPTAITTAALDDDRNVDVAMAGAEAIVVWDRDQGGHHDIMAQVIRRTAAGYGFVGVIRNLTAGEPGAPLSADQRQPVIATDGVRFCYSYFEGGTPRPFCATLALVGNTVAFHEGHELIAGAQLDHENLGIASMGQSGGELARCMVVTDERDGTNDYDVQGLLYDGLQPGPRVAIVQTGCDPRIGAEPAVAVTGDTRLGDTLRVTMSGHTGLPVLVAGVPIAAPPQLCGAVTIGSCRQGVQLPALASAVGTSFVLPIPPEPVFVGISLAIQGVDLGALACSATLFGAAFAVSDTVVATIR